MSKDPQERQADELVARLRAADPAAQAEPDLAALRAAVEAARAAEPGPAAEDGPTAGAPAVPDELAARRARRWTGWPAKVAGVAAAALLLGGGGYALGSAHDGGASGGDLVAGAGGAAPAISLQDGAAGGKGGAGMESADDGMATDAPQAVGGGRDSAYWGGYGRTVFTASGLSDEATTLHGYGFDSVGAFSQDTIARVAAALGVAGTPELRDGSWMIGPNDGSGPSLSLYPDGTVTVSYYDPTKDPYQCTPSATPDAGAGVSGSAEGSTTDVAPVPDPCQQRDLGPAAEGDAAAQVLRDVLSKLGLDPASFEFAVDHTADSPEWSYVTAYQVVNGQRSGLSWSAQLTGAGLQSLYGFTASLVDLGEYPVISPAAAVERLMDPRFASGFFGPVYAAADAVAGAKSEVAPAPSTPTVPPTATAGAAVSWPVQHATIVKARLGLALQTQPDGAALLVPTYELTSDEGDVWTVIAVADDRLDFGTD